IALALREVLETPRKTAFLVTADRTLARRVAAKLAGWGIELDDSGGAPLAGSYRATFMRLVSQLMADPSDPVALAGLIHHQLFGLGLAPSERRPLVQALDRFLRGRRPRSGWDGLMSSLDDHWRPYHPLRNSQDRERTETLLVALRDVFERHAAEAAPSVERLLEAHLGIALSLASTDAEDGAERLFRFEDGEVLEPHLEALRSRPELLGECSCEDYPELFDSFLQGPAFRPPGGQHPRLSVYGVLEGRLQTADLVIVGGLQEGVWPGESAVDPFLSRRMRHVLGLPSPEADIGRVGHDFTEFAAQPKVMLTRSERRGRAPARASRLMVRLESFLEKLDPERGFNAAPRLRSWRDARFGHDGAPTPAERPGPKPRSSVRPRRFSISTVGTWLRDPYAVYARYVLGLRPMVRYDEPFRANHRGDIVHKLLEEAIRWQIEDPSEGVARSWDRLIPDVLEQYDMPSDQRLLNNQFLVKARDNILAFEADTEGLSTPRAVEVDGQWQIKVFGETVSISGRADRV
ncbi:MAG: PD-(D/E)XK nuclease family protein, partial [Pseudomonadota bacterium]